MSESTSFEVDYYFTIIDKFYNVAVDFELIGDKFFELQNKATSISEEEVAAIENHPAYKDCEKKLELISSILKKIK